MIKKYFSISLIIILVSNFVLFVLGKINPTMFWIIIAIIAVISHLFFRFKK